MSFSGYEFKEPKVNKCCELTVWFGPYFPGVGYRDSRNMTDNYSLKTFPTKEKCQGNCPHAFVHVHIHVAERTL